MKASVDSAPNKADQTLSTSATAPVGLYTPTLSDAKIAFTAYTTTTAATATTSARSELNRSLVDPLVVSNSVTLWKCAPLPTAAAATAASTTGSKSSSLPAIESSIKALEAEQCDVSKDVYEGGFKVWEGCIDMLQFITNTGASAASATGSSLVDFRNRRVLCLGCGQGLVGIYALLYGGASAVCFQDYNASVLSCVTLPTLLINDYAMLLATTSASATAAASTALENRWKSLLSRVSFVSGDWGAADMLTRLQTIAVAAPSPAASGGGDSKTQSPAAADSYFDLILSEDTVYYTDNYPKLIHLHRMLLRPSDPQSRAYVSGKCYYFGNGGGTTEFAAAIEKDDNKRRSSSAVAAVAATDAIALQSRSVRTFGEQPAATAANADGGESGNSGNVREILCLTASTKTSAGVTNTTAAY